MASAGVPTARALVASTADEVAAALDEFGPPYVVKNDGLAAGKGVVVTADRVAATAHAAACGRVVIEEYLDGPEVSLFCVTDGTTVVPLIPAQDFKRIGDGDTGPNTGGMGAYAPLPWLPVGTVDEVVRMIAEPTVRAMRRARHAIRWTALHRAGAHRARTPRRRVQRPVRRSRDPGRPGFARQPSRWPAGLGGDRPTAPPPPVGLAQRRGGHRRCCRARISRPLRRPET